MCRSWEKRYHSLQSGFVPRLRKEVPGWPSSLQSVITVIKAVHVHDKHNTHQHKIWVCTQGDLPCQTGITEQTTGCCSVELYLVIWKGFWKCLPLLDGIDGWLAIYTFYNSISVTSGQLEDDYKRLRSMQRHYGSHKSRFELNPSSKLRSANRATTNTWARSRYWKCGIVTKDIMRYITRCNHIT